ncbi:MAG: response regulator [Planctomycetaceae bacterium]|nr:response regulator [Planctomycetaceae bacterium]
MPGFMTQRPPDFRTHADSRVCVPSKPTVFVVADEPSRLSALVKILEGMQFVVESFSSVDEYCRSYDAARRGCLLIDSRSCATGLNLQERLSAAPILPTIVYLTDDDEVAIVVKAVRKGAFDFLFRRSATESELWEALQKALVEDARNFREFELRNHRIQKLSLLSEGELMVLRQLLSGKNNREIAAESGLSRAAIEGRRTRLMKKLGVSNFPELIRFAVESGFDGEGSRRFEPAVDGAPRRRDSFL